MNSRNLTVLHTESSKGWGGQENRTLRESVGLRKLGARVIILCQPGSVLSERAAREGIEVRLCRMNKSYDLFSIFRIVNLIKKEKVDIVNTHSGRDSLMAGIAGRLSSGTPKVVRTRHLALPITSKFTYDVLPHKVVTVSEYVRSYLMSKGIAGDQIKAVPTGIDLGVFDPERTNTALRSELGIDPATPLIGTVAILRFKKGHHILLDAIPSILQRVPEAVFIFAGNGPQKENIEKKISELGLTGKVRLLGLRKDVPSILKSIDLFVLPTLQEALGTSFLEAMAMEKPVIGTNVDGVGEVIRDGVNGYLVPPNDPAFLAGRIVDVLTDKERSHRMGQQGRSMVAEDFSTEKMCERMHELYLSLLRGKKR